jgi:hypothetical protein
MSEIASTFLQRLPKVCADQILVDETQDGLNKEANANLWGFGLTKDQARDTSVEGVVAFILAVRDARDQQIIERFGRDYKMAMYCWFDGQMGSLRFSLVSYSHGKLPLGAPLKMTNSIEDIVSEF